MKRLLIVCSIFFAPTVLLSQTFECPSWSLSQWWDISSEFEILFSGEVPSEIVFQESDCRASVTSIQSKILMHGSHAAHLVYVVQYTGLAFGEGVIHYEGGPFPLNFNVRIPDTTITGEIWIDTVTLSLVSWSRSVSGRIETIQGSEWEDIGELMLELTQEYDPKWDQYQFPVAIDENWEVASSVFSFGDYRIALELFSPDVIDEQVFDHQQSFEGAVTAAEIEDLQGIETLRIETIFEGGGESTSWYAPELKWNKRFEQVDMPEQDNLTVAQIQYSIDEFGNTPATPQPTRTPIPSTPTPTSPPTIPPTPTPTGTQPTPTSTYTLPPWIPRTPTPTPTPSSSTSTPTPSDQRVSIQIGANKDVFSEGNTFRLATTLTNPFDGLFVMQYIILEYQSQVWFWPSWTPQINGQFRIIPAESQFADEVVLEFIVPRIEIPITGIRFWAVLTEPSTFDIVGDFGSCSIRFE